MADTRHLPELTKVRAAHRLDLDVLANYFTSQLPQFGGALTARQFKDGQSNPTYLLRRGSHNLVLRKKPPGDLLPGAHRIEREFRIISALATHGVPVPGAHHLCEDSGVIGTPFYVMDHVPGGVCQDPALPGMGAAERAAIYAAMTEVLAQLHGIDWKNAGLGDYGKHENYIARQIALWSRQYEASKTGTIAEMDRLMAWLPNNIPTGDETCLVHGDFRLGNSVLDPEASRIAAVLDWELDLAAAFALPNHVNRNGPIDLERGTRLVQIKPALESLGHEVHMRRNGSGFHGIRVTPLGFDGAADKRREGVADGD